MTVLETDLRKKLPFAGLTQRNESDRYERVCSAIVYVSGPRNQKVVPFSDFREPRNHPN
jgi:hypothetical protein